MVSPSSSSRSPVSSSRPRRRRRRRRSGGWITKPRFLWWHLVAAVAVGLFGFGALVFLVKTLTQLIAKNQ